MKSGEFMKVAVIQLCSHYNPSINLDKINKFIAMSKEQMNIEAVFLPEVFYSMSDGTRPTEYLVKEGNEHFKAIKEIAVANNVHLIGGSAATEMGGKIVNRAYNFAPDGTQLSSYDKIHLFRVDLSKHKSKTVINEADVYTAGRSPSMINIGEWRIGLGICFDIRFPELFRSYFMNGANLLTASAAFTVPTGKAHWETLLRARAIENQSYVIAAGQWGNHNERIKTYGHSLIIDPWGEIIADAGEGEGYIVADLDLERVKSIRERMDVRCRLKVEN